MLTVSYVAGDPRGAPPKLDGFVSDTEILLNSDSAKLLVIQKSAPLTLNGLSEKNLNGNLRCVDTFVASLDGLDIERL